MKKLSPGISETDKQLLLELLPKETTHIPSRETLERLISLGSTVLLEKGDSLIGSGECDPNLYIIIDGLLRCWSWNGDREETHFFSTIPTIFQNYNSYYAGEGAFYCYEACLDSKVMKVSKQDYDNLLQESHDFALWMLSLSNEQNYHFEMKALRDLGSAVERYERLQEFFPEILSQVPLGMIASYLKITPQYLSKIRRLGGKQSPR